MDVVEGRAPSTVGEGSAADRETRTICGSMSGMTIVGEGGDEEEAEEAEGDEAAEAREAEAGTSNIRSIPT